MIVAVRKKTLEPVRDTAEQGEPWVRMPKQRGRLCGLSRTTLLELSQKGFIRTVALRKPGAKKGIRLVHLPSLHRYLASLGNAEDEQ
jgi:hypothetical protein